MLKITLSTLVALMLFVTINAQENEQIKAWQQQHPNVVFVSNESFHSMSPQERGIIESREVIFFSGEISLDDIYSFEASNSEKQTAQVNNVPEYVKQWVSKNPEVKIIKNSEFQNATPDRQLEYLECTYCMVLEYEEISISDIKNFEQNKH